PGRAPARAQQRRLRRASAVGALRIELVDRDQRPARRPGGGRDRLGSPGQAVDHAERAGDLEPLRPHALDRAHRRAPRRDGVLDDEAAHAGLDRALDPALEAVALALAAHEEGHEPLAAGRRKGGARGRDRGRRRAADRAGPGVEGGGGDQLAGGPEPGGAQERAAGVHVVGGALAARQRDLADHERVLAELGQEGLAGPGEAGGRLGAGGIRRHAADRARPWARAGTGGRSSSRAAFSHGTRRRRTARTGTGKRSAVTAASQPRWIKTWSASGPIAIPRVISTRW